MTHHEWQVQPEFLHSCCCFSTTHDVATQARQIKKDCLGIKAHRRPANLSFPDLM